MSTISSLVVWVLWKAICKCISESQPECGLVRQGDIIDALHTLRGLYEEITSEPNVVFHEQQHFILYKDAFT